MPTTTYAPEPSLVPTALSLTVGPHTRSYVLHWTNAPASYDFGSVLTLYVGDDEIRYVLIPVETVEYQLGRNSSGLYQTVASDAIPLGSVCDKLYAALVRGLAAG